MDLVTVTRFLNGFLMIALPILLGIYLVNKFQFSWKIWLIGAATFVISQVPHYFFNNYALAPFLSNPGSLATAVALGLSSGVFEECARYGMFRWWLTDKRTWRNAILAGAGHGGVESILLGIYVLWIFINLVAVRNADLSKLNLTPEQLVNATGQIQAYWSVPWYNTLFGAVERVFIIPFQIMASVLVLQVFTRHPGKQRLEWLGLAIFLHSSMNASAVFIAAQWSPYAVEAILGGLAVIDVIIIFILRQPEPETATELSSSIPREPPIFKPEPIEETSENLDKTRFQ